MVSTYFIHLLILIGIYGILAVSLQLAVGFGGFLNLGHIAYYGIGAYTFTLLSKHEINFWLCLLLAGIFSAFFGWLLAAAVRKLKGDYLALVTLGFSFVVYAVFQNWTWLTNGPLGISGITRPNFLGFSTNNNNIYFILVFFIFLISYFFIYRVVTSPFGKVVEAVRDDELSAKSLGKRTFKIKLITFSTSAFFAGVAGSLYASYITYIDPSSFTLAGIIPVILIVIIGGLGSFHGTLLATFFIILLPEPLRFMGFSSSIVGPARQIIYAIILLATLYYKPKGFYGKLDLE
jgi:branched-chain amino acid transport system permease protein